MNIILFTKYIGSPMTLRMGHSKFYIISMSFIVLACSGLFYAGYWLGQANTLGDTDFGSNSSKISQVSKQRKQLADLERTTQTYLIRLSTHLGLLKAHIIRLNAFGERMTKMAKLDVNEFNFKSVPAQGGLYRPLKGSVKSEDFFAEMHRLAAVLKDREAKLSALESMLLHANIQRAGTPEGKPVRRGWTSSRFGGRRDPFTGRRTFHDGIDFAAPIGTPIYTVAAGVVTASGRRGGYGNTIEVSHGNGLVSRYAHNSRLLVKVGDRVRKGQKIALMGSTGRSTGSHVHYEILKNGKPISPHLFMVKKKSNK